MKKFTLIPVFAFLLVFTTSVKAQYVTIPDPSFVTWLNGHGFSSCLSGNQLDTTCSAVISTTTIDCSNSSITNLTGVTYFDTLITLKCSQNQLSFLPTLPSKLKYLECHHNQLTSLPVLPSTFKNLDCGLNQITTLPTLPFGMGLLSCYGNPLTTLPALPNTIDWLQCGNCQLTSLPALPNNLSFLACSNNQLTSLPSLPMPLEQIFCDHNLLTSLPPIPTGLTHLTCNVNQLTTLPSLPVSMYQIVCSDNNITSLPALPTDLPILDCSNNQLSTLPSLNLNLQTLWCSVNILTSLPDLPKSLVDLRCDSNQLTSLPALNDTMHILSIVHNPGIKCLPPIRLLSYFSWNNTGITCLPNNLTVTGLADPWITFLPICDLFNSNGCDVYWNISGHTFQDYNVNCIPDFNDNVTPGIKINLYRNNILEQQTFTDLFGQYTFEVDTGTYTYNVDTLFVPLTVSCPSTGTYTSSITLFDSIDMNMDFAISCSQGFDVGATGVLRLSGSIRPGDTATIGFISGDRSNLINFQCASGISGTVTVYMNGPFSFISPAPGSLTPVLNGSNFIYNIPDFGLTDLLNDFRIVIKIDNSAQVGDQVCFDVTVLPVFGDNNPLNNSYIHCFNVVNSYDPNDKAVSPTGATDTSQYWFTYTIRFQNTVMLRHSIYIL